MRTSEAGMLNFPFFLDETEKRKSNSFAHVKDLSAILGTSFFI